MGWAPLPADASLDGNTAAPIVAPAPDAAPVVDAPPPQTGFAPLPAGALLDNSPAAQAPSDDAVKAELTQRLQSGQDPAHIVHWLVSINRPPDKQTMAAILANKGNQSPDVRESIGGELLDGLKNDVAGIAQGAVALPDMAALGVGKVMSVIPNLISHGLTAAGHPEAAQWVQDNITHPLANPVQIGDAIEQVAPTPDTTAGEVNRNIGRFAGGIMGTPTATIENAVTQLVGDAPKAIATAAPAAAASITPEQAAAQGATDLGIKVPKFALSDGDRAAAGALEQTPFGRGPIMSARADMVSTSREARDAIASSVGTVPDTPVQLGDDTIDAAVAANKGRRTALGNMYSQAGTMVTGTKIPPTATLPTLDNILGDESERLAGSSVSPILQRVRDNIANAGTITVQQARDLRTDLYDQLTNEAGATPTNADRLTNQVMGAVNSDMDNGLKAAGQENALNIYNKADAGWAQQRDLEDHVLKPFLGKNFENDGDVVAKAINTAAKGRGIRLARFLSSLPDDQANNVRASIIKGLGRSSNANQTTDGDAMSLSNLVTNWSELSGSRKLIFAPETVQALDKLANVAQVGKLAERARNGSNTGGVISRLLLGGETSGAMVGFMTGHPHEATAGLLLAGLTGARQYGAAKLLANPAFAARLAKTPMNPIAATAYWSRPWVSALQSQNPAIASEIAAFKNTIMSVANDQSPNAAAASNGNQQPQGNQQ